jgi:hypothetical protein
LAPFDRSLVIVSFRNAYDCPRLAWVFNFGYVAVC